MPRPGGMHTNEKVKDLKGTLLRLFKDLDKWRIIFVISLSLSLFSALLGTIAPNRLSSVTDVISDGIKPNTENIKIVSEEIYKNVITCYFNYLISSLNFIFR